MTFNEIMEGTANSENFDFIKAKKEAYRYWEKRRWVFLILLIPPTLLFYFGGTEISTAVGDKPQLHDLDIAMAFVCAFICANVCYTFAYVIEFYFIGSPQYSWYLTSLRPVCFALGCFLGAILAAGTARAIAFSIYV